MQYGVKVIYTYSAGENKRKYYEEQILLVKAASFDEAFEKAENYVADYDREHTNPMGELVKTEKVQLLDCFLAFDEEGDVQEIYSATVKNATTLSEDAFYYVLTKQCDADETYDFRYKEYT